MTRPGAPKPRRCHHCAARGEYVVRILGRTHRLCWTHACEEIDAGATLVRRDLSHLAPR